MPPSRSFNWARARKRILSGVSHRRAHFAAVEMMNVPIAPAEDAKSRNVGVFRAYVGPCVLTGPVRTERKVRETALLLVLDEPLDWRTGRNGNGHSLTKVDGGPVP